jgi:Glycosyltransferases, probably involved in cell wall biogenesis
MLAADQSIELIIADGSSDEIFTLHSALFPSRARHVRPDPNLTTPMGKVGGVLTGIALATHERMIIADDDVRYDAMSIGEIRAALDHADVVRPQNYFSPLPFHAAWDTGRSLLNRISGGDWPGTLGVRRSAIRRANGYDGSAMFENLELVRTVIASGGTESVRPDIYVLRRPSTSRHFWSQRIRQAYDELARPARLIVQLAILPATATLFISATGSSLPWQFSPSSRWRKRGGAKWEARDSFRLQHPFSLRDGWLSAQSAAGSQSARKYFWAV